jgi:SPX domain protein involved in polyphosphate accumulation
MKFGVILIEESVPEWLNAYINYNLLKKLLGPF